MKTKILTFLAACLALTTAIGAVNVQTQPNGLKYTAIQFKGPPAQRYDLVFIGDGFKLNEQAAFNARVDDAVAALRARVPYSERMCAFNIWRVNVISTDSGVDHPLQNIFKNTELDCRYGKAGEAERCIVSDSPAKCFEAAGNAPGQDAVFVLVNDTQWGGCAGSVVCSSISPGFAGIITHELGHKIGLLADEYECYRCDGTDSTAPYAGPEPAAANATKATTLATIKWNSFITAGTPIPTTVDNPPGVVGLWEGAIYTPKGVFRPQFTCHMRTTGSEFCAVCADQMRQQLGSYCSWCELYPGSFLCWWMNHPERFRFHYEWPFKIRWPFPPCLTCPPDRTMDEIEYVVDGAPEGFRLSILDEKGRTIAEGQSSGGNLKVTFAAKRTQQYSVELTSSERATGKEVTLSTHIRRNGVAESRSR